MSKRAISDIPPEDYLLGVWPVSLQSQREYNTPFHLYFEKSTTSLIQACKSSPAT